MQRVELARVAREHGTTDPPDLKKKIATRGSYTRAMSPAEAVTFVQAEQRRWKPVLELIANKTNWYGDNKRQFRMGTWEQHVLHGKRIAKD